VSPDPILIQARSRVARYGIVARKFSIGRLCVFAGGLWVCAGGSTL